jgi:hypothetical protein
MTPARKALLAYAEAWTYPVIGNADVPVMEGLFSEARELAKDAAIGADDPPIFADWLKTLREAGQNSEEYEDALFAVADYFGRSTDL